MKQVGEKRIPDQLIETIRNRIDIVAVVSEHLTLKKTGQNFTGLCPFHSEKTPSFVVNPGKQFFHCFGCAAGGDVFHFISKIERISFPEAVRRCADKTGVVIPAQKKAPQEGDSESEQIYQVNEEAASFFHRNLMERPGSEEARAYLEERGVSAETIRLFSIGFALPRKDDLINHLKKRPLALLEKGCLVKKGENGYYDYFRNRIVFPIKTGQGRVVGFGARVLDNGAPKYLNTSETPVFTKGKHLFGLDLARGKKSLIVVEGYFDAVSLYQAGIHNVVATLGTALTSDHLRLIRRFVEKVHLLFDPDMAGLAAALRSVPLFIENEVEAEVVSLPAGCDPDLFVRKQGRDPFLAKLAQGESMIDFVIRETAQSGASSIEGRTRAIREIFPLIQKVANHIKQGYYLKKIAEAFGVEESDVRGEFARNRSGEAKAVPSAPFTGGGALSGVGGRTAGVVAPPGSSLRRRAPEDEETLLALLVQNQLVPERLHSLSPDDFTTPGIKSLLGYFWNAEEGAWVRPDPHFSPIDDAERALYTEMAVLEIPEENRQKLQEDCIRSLQTKRLRRESLKTQRELKSAEREGDRSRVLFLQQRFFNLKKELSQMAAHAHG